MIDVEVGDTVIMEGGAVTRRYLEKTVTKVTAKRIYCGNLLVFSRKTGLEVGKYNHSRIVTDPAELQTAKAKIAQKAAYEENIRREVEAYQSRPEWKAARRLTDIVGHMTTDDISEQYSTEQLNAAIAALEANHATP